ncbi:DNA-methyltransferase [Conexibacter woesei]|uniref:DNA-methyltransferase n=1 Tax=Conexibacter woesei TaxID=191495 RepID=UPI00041ABB9A|nr:site-specific DNA-methyltransferase [Conexibacter woesei]
MTPLLEDGQRWRVVPGDTLELLPGLPDQSVDAVVCDPPYGIDIKNHSWDGTAIRRQARQAHGRMTPGQAFERWTTTWAAELHRVLKPGGHVVAFGATRMTHRLTSGLEDGGLEIRDMLMWIFGPGIPKSRRFDGGRATTLKPFYEPIVLARRPVDGTTTDNLKRHGTGALNVDACAVRWPDEPGMRRWPAHMIASHDEHCQPNRCADRCPVDEIEAQRPGASRFLYVTKTRRSERDAGCEHLPARRLAHFPGATNPHKKPLHNPHPTVKPIELMRWLVRLITPPGGLVLDPFCGSGSTGIAALLEQRRFLGIERDLDYIDIARARITHWSDGTDAAVQEVPPPVRPTRAARRRPA